MQLEVDSVYKTYGDRVILFQKIRELSGGEIRYLEIRLMLMSKAPFVILDEP